MRIILACLSLILLAGCGGSEGAGEPNQKLVSPEMPSDADTSQPESEEEYYSKIACANLENCANACDFHYPITDEETVRKSVCWTGLNSKICDALVEMNAERIPINRWCGSLRVTDVIRVSDLADTACANDAACAQVCHDGHPFKDEYGVRYWASSGATVHKILDNQYEKQRINTCLASTVNQVFDPVQSPTYRGLAMPAATPKPDGDR